MQCKFDATPAARLFRRLLTLVVAAAGVAACSALPLASAAFAEPPSHLASAPFTGAAIVTNGHFVNLYLWPDPSKETWNAHVKKVAGSDPLATTRTINKITTALVRSSYFHLATQYGIEPPTFAGQAPTLQSCVTPVIKSATLHGGVIPLEVNIGELAEGYGSLAGFVACETAAHPAPQVNVFVSPDLQVAKYGSLANICPTSAAFHWAALGAANFTAIPTATTCNANIAALTHSLSHEMVETISDPAGFGFIDESSPPRILGGSFEADYNDGELADICQEKGLHPTPSTLFEAPAAGVGPLQVNPYWSNADAACEPRRIMNETLANKVGTSTLPDGSTGLLRMTSTVHTLSIPLTHPLGVRRHFLQALELDVTTGNDNLNGGNGPEDGADVLLTVRSNPHPIVLQHINQGADWGNNSLHAALLRVPPGITLGELAKLTISTHFEGADNWDIAAVRVRAAVACPVARGRQCTERPGPVKCPYLRQHAGGPGQPFPLVDAVGTTTLADGSIGLARLTGEVHSWRTKATVDRRFERLVVNQLVLTIKTGHDDLRSSGSPNENADAVITLTNGAQITFGDLNQHQEWSNYSETGEISLPMSAFPPKTTLGDIREMAITTNFGGGSGGDNWAIMGVELDAHVECELGKQPPPPSVTVPLLNAVGATTLADGSKGLARLTGEVHSWAIPVKPPSADAGKVIIGLELTVTTGEDDLRGGNAPQDNANAHITLVKGGSVLFEDINALQKWDNGSTWPVNLYTLGSPLPGETGSLPPGLKLGEISGLEISTGFEGGSGGDNWDIADVKLVATVD